MIRYFSVILAVSALMFQFFPFEQSELVVNPQPVELGKVKWLRGLEDAQQAAEKKDKPIFILFQEVPGCLTCRNYGQDVLSHPMIVEAIETLFVPLAIYNNKGGKDKAALDYFGEPSWNNPVVRIVDEDKKMIGSRVSGNYSQLGIVQAMIYALELENRTIPSYLQLLHEELQANYIGTASATVAMYCFWTGEKTYGELDGVISTAPGFMKGREVVTLTYNPNQISYEDLIQQKIVSHVYTHSAEQAQAANKLLGDQSVSSTGAFRLDREPKYYMSKTPYRFVPMTELQAARVNAAIGAGQSPNQYLSSRQNQLLKTIQQEPNKKWIDCIGQPITQAWEQVEKIL